MFYDEVFGMNGFPKMDKMAGWWQLIYFFMFIPIPGEMIQFD